MPGNLWSTGTNTMSEVLDRYKVAIVALLGMLIAAGSAVWVLGRPRPGPIQVSTPVPTPTATVAPTPTPAPLRIYVSGAVQQPDVYVLPPKSIVKDALDAAGGATDDADLAQINLAVELSDQQQVHVPRIGETSVPDTSPGTGNAEAPAAKVNINTASVEELDTLPGIGPAIAQRIVDYREANGNFATIEDLQNVKGIGPSTYEELKDRITVR
jgi:competence protein ComEA